MRHNHSVVFTKAEVLEALNLLRAKRELPLMPVDGTKYTGMLTQSQGSFEPGMGDDYSAVCCSWEDIE